MKLPRIRHFWTKDDLRPAALFAANAICWAVIVDLAYYRGVVIMGAILVACNMAAAVFRFALYMRQGRDARDINHD